MRAGEGNDLFDERAAEQHPLHREVVVEHDEIGGCPRPQQRDVVATDHACRCARDGIDRLDDDFMVERVLLGGSLVE